MKSFVLFFFAVAATTLSAQAPPAQKPEVEVPHAQTACDCHDLEIANARISRMEGTLKDWPDLSRYREANTTTAPLAKNEKRVVFMGDSITDAWVHPQFGGFFPGKPSFDRGIRGHTTPQMLIRFRPDVIALNPKVVLILAGTNDIAGNTGPMSVEEIEANLASMSELARAHKIRVVLASVLPIYDGGHNGQGKEIVMSDRRPPEKILALNAWIKKYCAENKLVYLDYFSAMVDDKGFLKRELSEDGLHPNKAGYAVMAPLAEKAIQSALKM
ncbi:MAG: SGNH/GDSL hydrolase family protein [Candidatus Acidiferrum sp.]